MPFATLLLSLAIAALTLVVSPATAQDRGYDRYDVERDELPWQGQGRVENGYPVPVPAPEAAYREPPPPSYKDDQAAPSRYYRKEAACLSKPALRLALKQQGWHNFDSVEYRARAAVMTADNDRGRRFEVEFDACSGDVIDARPIVADNVPPPRFYERPRYYGYYEYGPPRPFVGVHGRRHW